MRAQEFMTEAKRAPKKRDALRRTEKDYGKLSSTHDDANKDGIRIKIAPKHAGTLHPEQAAAMKSVHRSRDTGGYDRIYHMNRLWMAMAMADGKSHEPVNMDASSWTEKYNTIHPYTEAEENMVHQALATIPSDHHHDVSNRHSTEPESVNKRSVHIPFAGYPR